MKKDSRPESAVLQFGNKTLIAYAIMIVIKK